MSQQCSSLLSCKIARICLLLFVYYFFPSAHREKKNRLSPTFLSDYSNFSFASPTFFPLARRHEKNRKPNTKTRTPRRGKPQFGVDACSFWIPFKNDPKGVRIQKKTGTQPARTLCGPAASGLSPVSAAPRAPQQSCPRSCPRENL